MTQTIATAGLSGHLGVLDEAIAAPIGRGVVVIPPMFIAPSVVVVFFMGVGFVSGDGKPKIRDLKGDRESLRSISTTTSRCTLSAAVDFPGDIYDVFAPGDLECSSLCLHALYGAAASVKRARFFPKSPVRVWSLDAWSVHPLSMWHQARNAQLTCADTQPGGLPGQERVNKCGQSQSYTLAAGFCSRTSTPNDNNDEDHGV